jgi:hypothetical protein
MAVILLLFPIAVGLGTAVIAALLGGTLKQDAEARHQGSELLDLNT